MSTEAFFAFARERHAIYLRRAAGEPKPWTRDEVLRQFKFTNVFRELDATTAWIRENIRDEMQHEESVLLAMTITRWFNRISTLAVLKPLILSDAWTTEAARPLLAPLKPVFTNAYMINSPTGVDKVTGILRYIELCEEPIRRLARDMRERQYTLEEATSALASMEGLAGFMAYEIVTDVRWTDLLREAPDIMTWANPGPGCVEGIKRMDGQAGGKSENIARMQELLALSRDVRMWPDTYPLMEMRDIEHTLCEFAKYERTRLGEGTPKVMFDGGGPRTIHYGQNGSASGKTPRAPTDPNEAFIASKMQAERALLRVAQQELSPVLCAAVDRAVIASGVQADWLPVGTRVKLGDLDIDITPTRVPEVWSSVGVTPEELELTEEEAERVRSYDELRLRSAEKERKLREAIAAMEA